VFEATPNILSKKQQVDDDSQESDPSLIFGRKNQGYQKQK
jgi:hypothetical protein